MMAQATVVQPASQAKTCLICPYFNNFHESSGRGWCKLFDHQVREHHQITNDCIHSSETVISHELEDNLALFPNVDFEELQAFPSEDITDEADLPHAAYQAGSIVKIIDNDEHCSEWAVFEIVKCLHNKNLFDSTETCLNQSEWYYRLVSHVDGNTMPTNNLVVDKYLWVAENEICELNMSCNFCTEDIF